MKNLWTTIMVNDMDASVAFYTQVLSLTVDNRYKPAEGAEIAFLGSGETKLELICNSQVKEIAFTDHVSTGFAVDSVDEYIEYLADQGISVYQGPFEPSPRIKFFYIKDPNGYKIQLVEFKE
jgi:lactoylglutathione lyase